MDSHEDDAAHQDRLPSQARVVTITITTALLLAEATRLRATLKGGATLLLALFMVVIMPKSYLALRATPSENSHSSPRPSSFKVKAPRARKFARQP